MIRKGYKATDRGGKCRGYQFDLPKQNEDGSWTPGAWHEHEGELELCKSGFHWCEYPSGPYCYYSCNDIRVWNIEAEQTAELPETPGADYKLVSKRIRLVSEIAASGYGNTGDRNTGDHNTGNCNTGYGNTGDHNTGDRNTGDHNTGYGNTGYGNTGDRNAGDRNTGYGNTGNCNTGDHNTGYGNTGDRSSGFFCSSAQKVKSFDVQTELTYDEYVRHYPEYCSLGLALMKDDPIPFERYKSIPGITRKKLKALHDKFKAARSK